MDARIEKIHAEAEKRRKNGQVMPTLTEIEKLEREQLDQRPYKEPNHFGSFRTDLNIYGKLGTIDDLHLMNPEAKGHASKGHVWTGDIVIARKKLGLEVNNRDAKHVSSVSTKCQGKRCKECFGCSHDCHTKGWGQLVDSKDIMEKVKKK